MDYISEIIVVINQVHRCAAVHRATVSSIKAFGHPRVWRQGIEVFTLVNHPKAQKAYAWGPSRETEKPRKLTIVLEIPRMEASKATIRDF